MHALPALPVAVPLVIAAFLAGVNRHIPRWVADSLAILAALLSCAVCAYLVHQSAFGDILYWFGGWTPRGGVALGISFAIDPMGAGIAAFAAALVVCSLIFSIHYFDSIGTLFHVLMLAFLAAMCGFSLTGDLFNLFVFFELMSAAAFALCGYKTEEGGPLEGSLNFAITNTIGAFLVLSGIGLLYGRTGALNMAQIGRSLGTANDALVVVAFVLILCGFGIKAAIAPFHFWLADAHAVAPTPVCILFSGVMVELALYAIARVYWTIFQAPFASHLASVRAMFIAFGIVTALLGAFMCFAQHHIKRLLAFSTISHMGLLFIAFGLLTPRALSGAAIYFLGHGAVKAALFIAAGILLHRVGSIDEFKVRGRGSEIGGGLLAVIALAVGLAGVPPYGTFLGENAIDHAAEGLHYAWLSYIFIVASVITAAAVLRVIGGLYFDWGPPREQSAGDEGARDEGPETGPGHERVPAVMWAPMIALLLFGIGISFVPHMRSFLEVAARRFQDQAGYEAQVLEHSSLPTPMPGPLQSVLPGIIRGLVSTFLAVLLALIVLFRHRLPGLRHLPDRIYMKAMHPFRAIHSGIIGDYVAWLTFGVALMGGIFYFIR